jgi:hypothetical protein
MYIYVRIYIYIYIYTYTYIYLSMCTYMQLFTHTTFSLLHSLKTGVRPTYIYDYKYIYIYIYKYLYSFTRFQYLHSPRCIYTCIYIPSSVIRVSPARDNTSNPSLNGSIYCRPYVYIHICIIIYVHINIYMKIHMCVCINIYIYVLRSIYT